MEVQKKLILIMVVLAGLILAFTLGRLSNPSEENTSINILSASAIKNNTKPTEIQLRASSQGKKYYLPWCVSSFNEVNTIYFSSEEEAQDAGYQKATNCLDKTN